MNLKTADTIVKVVLAAMVIISYSIKAIAGPLAFALMIVAVIVLAISLARIFFTGTFMD